MNEERMNDLRELLEELGLAKSSINEIVTALQGVSPEVFADLVTNLEDALGDSVLEDWTPLVSKNLIIQFGDRLYEKFGEKVFTIEEASQCLGHSESWTRNLLNRHSGHEFLGTVIIDHRDGTWSVRYVGD